MKFSALKKHIADGRLRPCYLLFGDDGFISERAAAQFKSLVRVSPEFNVSYFCDSSDSRGLVEAAQLLPLMDAVRVVIAENFSGAPEPIVEYLKNPNPSSVLVFVQTALAENFSAVVNLSEPVDCGRQSEDDILTYISAAAAKRGCSATKDAARLLIRSCNGYMFRIASELEKLCAFKAGGVIESADVGLAVTPELDFKIYELSEAVAAKRGAAAGQILKTLLATGAAPATLLGLIYSHFRRLLFASVNKNDPDLARLLGVKSYAAQKAGEQAARYTPRRLKAVCDLLNRADYAFKSGTLTDAAALELCVMKILSEGDGA
ncbi:MAG: DNA polymerase III subunit delta [Clostridiales bacterium]|jgi:DNA polymerase-3 subunit delta|nr:DNA polymerase III subunit delta [Clostridiales bacterium]